MLLNSEYKVNGKALIVNSAWLGISLKTQNFQPIPCSRYGPKPKIRHFGARLLTWFFCARGYIRNR
jgi:hypothetical protein